MRPNRPYQVALGSTRDLDVVSDTRRESPATFLTYGLMSWRGCDLLCLDSFEAPEGLPTEAT